MLTRADRLRSLVKEATRGPWRFVPDSDEYIVFAPQEHPGHAAGHGETPANTRLMALAPQLAELAADMAEALEFYADEKTYTQMTSWGSRIIDEEGPWITDCGKRAVDALAEFAALFPEDSV